MNIVLTGLRGSGKSTIGKILADKMNYKFVDIDDEIEKSAGEKIETIVSTKGWEEFRKIEKEVTTQASQKTKTIIATGGGTIIDHDNEKALRKNGKIIYLYIKPEKSIQWILNDPNRPSLTSLETVEEEVNHLYKKRNGRYCESANLVFERTEDIEKDAINLYKKLNAN